MRYLLFGEVRRIVRVVRYTVGIRETKNETPFANELRNTYTNELQLSSNIYFNRFGLNVLSCNIRYFQSF